MNFSLYTRDLNRGETRQLFVGTGEYVAYGYVPGPGSTVLAVAWPPEGDVVKWSDPASDSPQVISDPGRSALWIDLAADHDLLCIKYTDGFTTVASEHGRSRRFTLASRLEHRPCGPRPRREGGLRTTRHTLLPGIRTNRVGDPK